MKAVACVCTALSVATIASAKPPRAAFEPVRLVPIPIGAVQLCRRAQAAALFVVLCPARLPRATLGVPLGRKPQRLKAIPLWNPRYPRRRDFQFGLSFGYGAPVEPSSSTSTWSWRTHLWWNRPCCFLHFTVARRSSLRRLPPGRVAILAGHRGWLVQALGPGLREGRRTYYWANHTWFFWRQHGVHYVASLHLFGTRRETLQLFTLLMRQLRPVSRLGK